MVQSIECYRNTEGKQLSLAGTVMTSLNCLLNSQFSVGNIALAVMNRIGVKGYSIGAISGVSSGSQPISQQLKQKAGPVARHQGDNIDHTF